jgi:hypothetical protein
VKEKNEQIAKLQGIIMTLIVNEIAWAKLSKRKKERRDEKEGKKEMKKKERNGKDRKKK